MSGNISEGDALSFVKETEITERDAGRFENLKEILGRYRLDPEKMTRAHLRNFVMGRLEMGATMTNIAEELALPVEVVPMLINVVLGEDGLEAMRKNQLTRFAGLASVLAPDLLRLIHDALMNGKPGVQVKYAALLAQILGLTGPQTVINNQQNTQVNMPSKEMVDRYDPSNLEKLLGRKVTVIDGTGQADPPVERSGDPAAGDPGDAGEHSGGVRLDVLDARPAQDG